MGRHERAAYVNAAWMAALSILSGLELARTDDVKAAILAVIFAGLAAAYACEADYLRETGE